MDTIIRGKPDRLIAQPGNKGKLTGAKPPLCPKHVWAIRTRLQLAKRHRDPLIVGFGRRLARPPRFVLVSLRTAINGPDRAQQPDCPYSQCQECSGRRQRVELSRGRSP
jgi:hypothetical protein